MQNRNLKNSRPLIISKCLYVLMSFLSLCTFSESAISFLSPSFNKTSNVQLWLTATQVSVAVISLFIMGFLIDPIKRRVTIKRWEAIALTVLIVGCVEVTYLTDVTGSLRQITSFDLSISSSVCFMISTLVLMTSLLSFKKSDNHNLSCWGNAKKIICRPLFLVCLAQIIANGGFVIQSLAGNNYPIWNDIAFSCFVIGVASALFLFKKDAKHLYDSVMTNKKTANEPPKLEMVKVKTRTPFPHVIFFKKDRVSFYNAAFAPQQFLDNNKSVPKMLEMTRV